MPKDTTTKAEIVAFHAAVAGDPEVRGGFIREMARHPDLIVEWRADPRQDVFRGCCVPLNGVKAVLQTIHGRSNESVLFGLGAPESWREMLSGYKSSSEWCRKALWVAMSAAFHGFARDIANASAHGILEILSGGSDWEKGGSRGGAGGNAAKEGPRALCDLDGGERADLCKVMADAGAAALGLDPADLLARLLAQLK